MTAFFLRLSLKISSSFFQRKEIRMSPNGQVCSFPQNDRSIEAIFISKVSRVNTRKSSSIIVLLFTKERAKKQEEEEEY